MRILCVCTLMATAIMASAAVGTTFSITPVNSDQISFRVTSENASTHTGTVAVSALGVANGGTYTGENIRIPETVEYNGYTYTVTCIESDCFKNSKVKYLSIPITVTEVQSGAFKNAKSLTDVYVYWPLGEIPNFTQAGGSFKPGQCNLHVPNGTAIDHDSGYKDQTPFDWYQFKFPEESGDDPVATASEYVETWKSTGETTKTSFNRLYDLTVTEANLQAVSTIIQNGVSEEVNSISYIRTFNNTNWQPLFVPFTIRLDTDLTTNFEFATLAGTIGVADEDERDVITLITVAAAETIIPANTPCFIRAKSTGTKTIFLPSTESGGYYVTVHPTDGSFTKNIASAYTLDGTYSTLAGSTLDGSYALNGGDFYKISATASIKPYRTYLSGTGSSNTNMRLRFVSPKELEEAAAIKEVENSNQPLNIYNLNGQKMDSLHKGINIINGKKVYIK